MIARIARLCRRCGKIFPERSLDPDNPSKCCSSKCKQEHAKQWKVCVWCGKEYHASRKTIMCRWCRSKFRNVRSKGPLVCHVLASQDQNGGFQGELLQR
jgi:ribosomal protein S14